MLIPGQLMIFKKTLGFLNITLKEVQRHLQVQLMLLLLDKARPVLTKLILVAMHPHQATQEKEMSLLDLLMKSSTLFLQRDQKMWNLSMMILIKSMM